MEEVEDRLRKRRPKRSGIRLRDAKVAGGHDGRCGVDQDTLDVNRRTRGGVMVCGIAPTRRFEHSRQLNVESLDSVVAYLGPQTCFEELPHERVVPMASWP